MVHFRKRFSAEVIEEINQAIFLAEAKAVVEEEPEDSGSTSKSPDAKEDLSVSKLVQYMKGNTSRKLQMEYKEINKQFWGKHLWARGYFAASSGNVTDDVIAEYIRLQDIEEHKKNDNFRISEL